MLRSLEDWNPWWADGRVPEALRGRPRQSLEGAFGSLEAPEVTALAGIRRCGKTTLMLQMVDRLLLRGTPRQNVCLVNLEDPAFRSERLEDLVATYLQAFAPRGRVFLFLDEVQACEGWEAWVRKQVDLKQQMKVVVSGSSSALLRGEYATLLTGRNLTFSVHPLTFAEYLGFHGLPAGPPSGERERAERLHHLDAYLDVGGFPEVNLRGPSAGKALLKQYFDDILFRDVVARRGADPAKLAGFASYLATNFARPLRKLPLARAVGLSVDAVRDYLAYLEGAFMMQVVQYFAWSAKAQVREQHPFKVYWSDTGLRNAGAARHARDLGRLAENLVATELRRRHGSVAYWKGRHEVDFIVSKPGGRLEAVQVCYGSDVPERETLGLREVREHLGSRVDTALVLTRDLEEGLDGAASRPLWRWLLEGPSRA